MSLPAIQPQVFHKEDSTSSSRNHLCPPQGGYYTRVSKDSGIVTHFSRQHREELCIPGQPQNTQDGLEMSKGDSHLAGRVWNRQTKGFTACWESRELRRQCRKGNSIGVAASQTSAAISVKANVVENLQCWESSHIDQGPSEKQVSQYIWTQRSRGIFRGLGKLFPASRIWLLQLERGSKEAENLNSKPEKFPSRSSRFLIRIQNLKFHNFLSTLGGVLSRIFVAGSVELLGLNSAFGNQFSKVQIRPNHFWVFVGFDQGIQG